MECAGFLWSNHWGIVRLLLHLGVSGAIIWCFLLMGGVMLSCWGGMLEISSASLCILECRCQVVLLHIPTLVWLKVYSAGPVLGYLVLALIAAISWSVSFLLLYLIPNSSTARVKFVSLSWCVQSPGVIFSGAYPYDRRCSLSTSLVMISAFTRPHITF